ncbi:hypothetical protein PSACC_00981 [Paramicrosporidium saccamoebae]|uniref:Serine/threonine-protein phosphatase 4 regulatory subunit 3-like central domain-containing protein n=1 Tax=Paramicrosporidium saccamoebae TaxID=1246581 RepID=A0A2H9TNF7_9FUNG|nr:hypothetical protein PSACC_00981 [Paramicrosporidium saccamoebae]
MSEEDSFGGIRPTLMSLPEEVEFNTVPNIDEILERASNAGPDIRRPVCIALMENNYVGKLLDLFRIAEDLDSRETLFRMYSIFKHLVLLNNPAILRELLSEQHVYHVAGVFEYDPSYPDTRPGYRQFLLDRSRFKQVLDLENPQLVDLIHQTFRIQYLKDVVLPRILDEETFGSLLFMVRCNFAEIIEIFEGTEDFMPKLVPLFKSESVNDCMATLKFMKEFLTVAKASSNGRNLKLYQGEAFSGFLQFIQRMLSGSNALNRLLALDVLIGVTQHDPSIVRLYMMDHRSDPVEGQLLAAIIDRVRDAASEVGLRWQLVAVLRTLLDSPGPMGLPIPNDDFLNFFYPDYALRLLSPIVELDKTKRSLTSSLDDQTTDLYLNCCELLCSFITQHKYRIKYLLFRSFVVHNVLFLLQCQEKILRLAAVRVVRTMVGTGDDFYFRFLLKQSLLKPIIDEAVSLGTADNALSSALTEFFYFIRDVLPLESYKADLEKIQFAPIWTVLLECYNDLNNPLSDSRSIPSDDSKPRDTWLGVDRNEEAYFATEDDDEEEAEEALTVPSEEGMNGNHVSLVSESDLVAVEMEMPHKMATTWLAEDELDRTKRMKY